MMTRASSWAVTVSFALITAASGRAQTSTWELGHPDAKLLVGIDLKALRDSATGQAFGALMKGPEQPPGPAAFAAGFLEQIDRIFISSPAQLPPSGAGDKTAAAGSIPFLAVVEGQMSLQQLLAFLPRTAHRYHDVDVYRGANATDTSMAMLDARTILLGDEKSVLAAIDRRGRALPASSAILKCAQEMAATHESWVITEAPLMKFRPTGAGPTNAAVEEIASRIQDLETGLSVRDGFRFDTILGMENEAVAARMAQLLSSEIAAAVDKQEIQSQLPPEIRAQASEMLKRLHIAPDGARLRIRFALTAAEFAQQMQKAQAAFLAGNAAGRARIQPAPRPAQARPSAPKPQPATPGKVKIYGLDGGVREIQLNH